MTSKKLTPVRVLKRTLLFISINSILVSSPVVQAFDIVQGNELVNMIELDGVGDSGYVDTAINSSIGVDNIYSHWDTVSNSLRLDTSIEGQNIHIRSDINLGYDGGKRLLIGLEYDNWVEIYSNIYGGGSLNIGPTSFFDYDGNEATSRTAVLIGGYNNPSSISDVDLDFNVNVVKIENGSTVTLNQGDGLSHRRYWYDINGLNGGGFVELYGAQDIHFQNVGRIEQFGSDSVVRIDGLLESGDYVLQGGNLTTESTDVTGVFEQYSGTKHRLEGGSLKIMAGGEYVMHGGQLYADRIDLYNDYTTDPAGFTYHDGGVRLTNQDIHFKQKNSADPNQFDVLHGDLGAHIIMERGEVFGARNMIVGTASGLATSSQGSIHLDGASNFIDNDMIINDLGSVTQDSGYNRVGNNLIITGGAYTQNNGSNVVEGDIQLSRGVYTLNNGSLTAGRISGSGFNYINGGVRLTNSDMSIRSGGTLGVADLLIDESERFAAVNMVIGTASPDSGSVTQSTGSNVIENQLTINSGGRYDMSGGVLAMGSFTGPGKINYAGGEVYINDMVTIGTTGVFGDNLLIARDGVVASSSYDSLRGYPGSSRHAMTIDTDANLTLDGGRLIASEIINNGGSFNYLSGRLELDTLTFGEAGPLGSFTLNSGHNLTVSNAVNIEADTVLTITGSGIGGGAIINNSGTLTLAGGSLSTSQINNLGSGSFDFNSGSLAVDTLEVSNTGLLGSTVILGSSKTIQADNVTVAQGSRLEVNGGNSSATNLVNDGEVVISQAGRLSGGTYTQSLATASTTVEGTRNANVDIINGMLSGSGTINGNTVNAAIVGPGSSPGELIINGNFTQTETGLLHMEIGGLLAGDEYDVLNISGTATLAGTLDLDLTNLGSGIFKPGIGDAFDILTAESIIGEFDILSLAVIGGGLGWQLDYLVDEIGTIDVARLTVVEVAPVPVPAAIWLFGSGLLGLVSVARRKK